MSTAPGRARDYEVRILKVELDKDAKKYVPHNDVKMKKVNKSDTMISGNATLAKAIPMNAIVRIASDRIVKKEVWLLNNPIHAVKILIEKIICQH